MDENTAGKHLSPDASNKRPVVLIVAAVVIAVLLAAYLGLCIYAGASQTIFPNVSVAGVDVGGMTQAQAEEAVNTAVDRVKGNMITKLNCGSWAGTFAPEGIQADASEVARQAWNCGRGNFFTQGFQMIRHTLGKSAQVPLTVSFNDQGEAALDSLLNEADEALSDGVIQPSWTLEDDMLVLIPGVPGRSIDPQKTRQAAQAALSQGVSGLLTGEGDGVVDIPLSAEETAPEALDLQVVYDAVYTEPRSAEFDVSTRSIIPHVTGISFDVEAAQSRLDAAGEGQRLSIPLELTEPEMTTEQLESHLFSDVLGECTTTVDGTANRVSNVTLAAEHCDEYILLPGEVFSYNDVVGPRTTAAGFKPAPAYVQGQTVDEVGGGICQVSSTIYLAALRSNLEIVERRNHSYISSYITAGMDATVAYNAIDFKFKNDTDYPIKIEAGVTKRTLTVRIWGAKTDDVTVKMTYSILSSTPAGVVYKADDSVPAGTTKVSVTPYTGYKVAVYRNLYDGDGNLISSTQESMNTYNKRDKVILYNPADAASLGITTGGTVPSASPEPSVSPEPSASPEPDPSTSPEPSASPEPSPSVDPEPSASAPETPEPTPSTVPETSDAPEPSSTPNEGE